MNKQKWSVEKMCKVLEVSRNSYYNWLKDRRSGQISNRARLIEVIRIIHVESFSTYGSPRITVELNKRGLKASRKFVAMLMRMEGIRSILSKKFIVTTDSKHNYRVSDNLLDRNFKVEKTGKVWVSDITYFKVGSK